MNNNFEIQKLLNSAIKIHQSGNLKDAEVSYKEILKAQPNNSIVLYLLGTLSAQLKKFTEAIILLKKSLNIDNKNADAHYNLGNVFQTTKKYDDAISSYLFALKINSKYLKAYYNLGQIYSEKNNYKKSLSAYNNAIKINPNYADAVNNIGALHVINNKLYLAEKFFKKAVLLEGNNAKFSYNYATVLQDLKKYKEAALSYENAISLAPNYPKAYNNLGLVYKKLNRFLDALKCYEKAIEQDPKYPMAYNNLGNILDIMCEHEKAIDAYKKSIELDPEKLSTKWALMNTFPVIYSDTKEIKKFKIRFSENIKSINNFLDSSNNLTKKNIISGITNSANFYLHYQGENNIKDQKKYAKLIERLTSKIYPNYLKRVNNIKNSKIIKIGFISSTCFNDHSVSSVIKNWILKLNHKIFKVYIYQLNVELDKTSKIFKKKFKNFFIESDVDKIINKIASDKLNFLIYPDIGMDPKIQLIASLRLAPFQCQTMGHPVSSCFKNIDYFLSSELMETKNSSKNYNEKLYKLPNTGQCYEYPKFKLKINKKNKINNDIIFFNLQNLFKLLPNDDDLCVELVKKINHCKIWFIEGKNSKITELFKKRLKIKFEKNKLNFEESIILHKRLSQNRFFELMDCADIILDSLNWSGNCTTHQAINLNKPIITLPGKYMRSRHSYGLLKKMNLEETIAKSKSDYIKIAFKLANDIYFRKKIIQKIKLNKKKLFNDFSPIKGLENFLIDTNTN